MAEKKLPSAGNVPPPLPDPIGGQMSQDIVEPSQALPPDFAPRDVRRLITQMGAPAYTMRNSPPPIAPYWNGMNPTTYNATGYVPSAYPSNGSNYSPYNSLGYNSWSGTPYPRRHAHLDPSMQGMITRLAEEKTQPAFRSIETILEAVSSINMILESTYSAIQGSFRTLTGVADHLIFVRNHFAQIALFPRLFQVILNFLRWLLKAFGLDQSKLGQTVTEKTQEAAWADASSADPLSRLLDSNDPNPSLWPVAVFFSLVLGTPYIIWRLLGAQGSIPRTNRPQWTLQNGRHFRVVTLHDFVARTANELSFKKGQTLYVKPESWQPDTKWLVACHPNGSAIGFIPFNYVKLPTK